MKTGSVAAIATGAAAIGIVAVLVLAVPLFSIPAKDENGKRSPLNPVSLLTQRPEQIAPHIVEAAGDKIVSLRLNDTDTLRVIAYTTTKGDIILPIDGLEDGYSRIEYWLWEPIARPLSDSDAAGDGSRIEKSSAMNFTKAFLQRIGYKLDGSEYFIAEPGDISTITVYQTVSGCEGSFQVYGPLDYGCIVANQPTLFHFQADGGWIELRKWYEDVHQKEIKVAGKEATSVAKSFIEEERRKDPEKFEAYGNLTFSDVWQAERKETYKDNLVYAVIVSYLTDKSPEEYHCAPNMNFDVLVSVEDGKALDWRPSACV
ncbi:hypothetical protein [Nitrososphaera sp.]|uniref:hypothetical protein n=1 Tax=Nitrososphaera sp. TaxID=1971748 RepID=UPI001810D3E6|nr:hypothetical protein [Nitrososphaera sp.]NWG38138.1 hypothetical protein [Nitrososphaera sp.]